MEKTDVTISPLTFAKIVDWVSSNTEREIGGYLIGKIADKKVVITDAVFATAESNPTFVSFDNMLQFKILEELEERGKGEMIHGWFHSHPGMNVFMSGTDIATHKIYQALLPEAVAMVNDGNLFARSRKQTDFKTKFFRVNEAGKAYELSFNVLTNPNELVDLLTQHVQNQENAEKIAEHTAQLMSLNIDHSLKTIVDQKLVSKEEFSEESSIIKKALTNTREDIDKMKDCLISDEEFINFKLDQNREMKFLRLLLYISLAISSLSFILTIVMLILSLLPK